MKSVNRKTIQILLIFLALWVSSHPLYAEENADVFLSGYKAYLRKDFKKAVSIWRPLAEKGHSDSQYQLGVMYRNGLGVTQDFTMAGRWFLSSARQGDVGAQYLMGDMCMQGLGMPQNSKQAGLWFLKAALQGYPDAQYRLGDYYAGESGSVRNLFLAYVWLRLAAANGIQAGHAQSMVVAKALSEEERQHADRMAQQWWNFFEQVPETP